MNTEIKERTNKETKDVDNVEQGNLTITGVKIDDKGIAVVEAEIVNNKRRNTL